MTTLNPLDVGAGAVPVGPSAPPPAGEQPPTDQQLVQETRQQIRALVQEITQLTQAEISVDEFYDEFLTRLISALACQGGAIWSIDEHDVRLARQINLPAELLESDGPAFRQHELLVKRWIAEGKPTLTPPRMSSADQEAGNPTDSLLVAGFLVVQNRPQAVVEVFQRAGGGPTTQRGYLRFLVQMCELASGFLTRRQLQRFHDREALWEDLEQFISAAHQTLDLSGTCFTIVNEARRLLECDRVSLALFRGRRCEVEAISGLDSLDRRAAEVTLLGQLSRRVAAAGEPLWRQEGQEEPAAPQIEEVLDEYLDVAHSKLLAITPLYSPRLAEEDTEAEDPSARAAERASAPLGALIIEQMQDARPPDGFSERVAVVSRHAASALHNSLEHSRLFLMPLWKAIGSARWLVQARMLPRTVVVLALIIGCLAALILTPAEFRVQCRGKLLPVDRRDLFARVGGTVIEAPVRHGQIVKKGDLLVRLRNRDLEDKLSKLTGQLLTIDEQLQSRNAVMIKNQQLTPLEQEQLAGELRQLTAERDNLRDRIELVKKQRQALTIQSQQRSQVVTWRVREQLQRRPVRTGDILMTLVDPEGPWELELQMPEADIGYVDAASVASDKPLTVSFLLTSHPERPLQGELIEIQRSTDVEGPEAGNFVRLRVRIRKEDLPELRNEANVVAQVVCGRRSLAFVWFHDVWETVQKQWLLWSL